MHIEALHDFQYLSFFDESPSIHLAKSRKILTYIRESTFGCLYHISPSLKVICIHQYISLELWLDGIEDNIAYIIASIVC